MMNEKELHSIAELAVLGCKRNPQAHVAQECLKCEFHPYSCNQWQHAEKAINVGYCKIPEGSVVISKEEYTELKQRPEKVHDEMDERMMEELAIEKRIGEKKTEKARKETSKEILKKIYDEIEYYSCNESIKQLAKEYGVEIE